MISKKKALLGGVWITALIVVVSLWLRSGMSAAEVPDRFQSWLQNFGIVRAGLLYVFLFIIRSVTFFPASLFLLAAGLIFGPWLGILITNVGEMASAVTAFLVARYFGRDWVRAREHGVVERWDEKIRRNGVMSVMIMRLVLLPFDVVNYGCGVTAVRLRDYAIGSFLGLQPALIAFVLLGATGSAEASGSVELMGRTVSVRLLILLLAGVFLMISIGVAQLLKRRDSA